MCVHTPKGLWLVLVIWCSEPMQKENNFESSSNFKEKTKRCLKPPTSIVILVIYIDHYFIKFKFVYMLKIFIIRTQLMSHVVHSLPCPLRAIGTAAVCCGRMPGAPPRAPTS
jgi:hypothetical protein